MKTFRPAIAITHIILGSILLTYYIYLSIRYGFNYIVFSWTFACIGIIFLLYGIFSFIGHQHLLQLLPKRIYQIFRLLFCIGLIFFTYIEGCIIYKGAKPSAAVPQTAIVLGAQLNGDHISRLLRYRLEAALIYALDNPNATLIVSGGQGPGENRSEASAMKEYLVERGVAEHRILEEDASLNTQQNLTYSKDISPSDEVVIITNSFHSYRADRICKQSGLTCSIYPAKTDLDLAPNFYFREFFAVIKDMFLS